MKPFRNVGVAALSSIVILLIYLLNKGVLIGSTAETVGHVSGTDVPIYRQTCRYLSLNGVERLIAPPRLSEDFRCPLVKG
jgi:hypothetical protein